MEYINLKHRFKIQYEFTGHFGDREFIVYAETLNEARQKATEYFRVRKQDKDKLEVHYGYSGTPERAG